MEPGLKNKKKGSASPLTDRTYYAEVRVLNTFNFGIATSTDDTVVKPSDPRCCYPEEGTLPMNAMLRT